LTTVLLLKEAHAVAEMADRTFRLITQKFSGGKNERMYKDNKYVFDFSMCLKNR